MQTKLYSPDQVFITFGPHKLEGYADGTFVKVERDEDSFMKKTGADAEVARTRNLNKGGKVTVTLLQTSKSNAIMETILLADEVTPAGAGVLPLMVKNAMGYELHSAAEAWIKKPADSELGKEVGNREWVLDCAALSWVPPPNALA
jgi:hypothetical protein